MASGSMVPKVGGTFVGMVGGAILIGVSQMMTHRLYPPPPGLKPEDSEGMAAHVAGLPTAALVCVLAGYLLGSIVGGTSAGFLARGAKGSVIFTGFMLLVMALLNLMTIPHPTWFNVAVPIVFLIGTLLSIKITKR